MSLGLFLDLFHDKYSYTLGLVNRFGQEMLQLINQ